MRLLVLMAVLGVVAGVYSLGGNKLDEAMVREFYERSGQAFAEQDDETLCAMLDEDFEQVTLYRADQSQARDVVGKQDYCREMAQSLDNIRRLREVAGRHAPVDYRHTLTRITIAPDKHTAVVETRATMQLPGVNMTARSRDTLIRDRWRIRVKRSEGTTFIGPAYPF